MRRRTTLAALPGIVLSLLCVCCAAALAAPPLNVGSKRFTESYILGEIIKQTAQGAGETSAVHQQGLGNTAIVLNALATGAIDVYPEYTGTIAREILKLDTVPPLPELNAKLAPMGLAVGVPLGFNNTYALALRGDEQRRRDQQPAQLVAFPGRTTPVAHRQSRQATQDGDEEHGDIEKVAVQILKDAGAIGILADQNTMPEESVFVDFFGKSASTTTGIARMALHTDAAVVPGYAVWDESIQKYRLRFEPAMDLVRTGDVERDVLENTQRFTKMIEDIIRKYPDQWVWVHGRWSVQPKGKPPVYDFS